MQASIRWHGALLAGALLGATSGCVDEQIVYRNGRNFKAPPAAAANFIGYDDQATKLTVCGNCHVGQQGRWQGTKHADAFKTLEASGQMQGFCQKCHTVNDLGNVATDTAAGFRSTKDVRYQDVQCESCHGSGANHAAEPKRGQMLASIAASATATNGCAECHAGTHHPFVEEWSSSRHSRQYTGSINNASCVSCHNGAGVLKAWGVNTNFTEAPTAATQAFGLTCTVCHDPHGSSNPKQLRFAVDSRNPDENLCMKCHNRRASPDPASSQSGTHAPSGPVLLGTAGWWPPGITVDGALAASHGSTRNPRLCATCHVASYDVNDKATGKFVVKVTGHQFRAIPCVDANGQPTTSTSCAITARTFKTCVAAGCHDSEAIARNLYTTIDNRITPLVNEVKRLLALVPASELAAGPIYTTARGTRFNQSIAEEKGSRIHNPFLVENLLRASIAQMARTYNLQPQASISLAPYDSLILARQR